MNLLKNLKRVGLIFGSLIVFFLVVVAVVLSIGISINIDGIRAKAETIASKALGRKVSINGPLALDLSFRPSLELEGLQIANPSSWDSDKFIELKLFRAQIRILPLIRSRIHIQEITAHGIDVHLELKSDGRKNWLFDLRREETENSPPPADSNESFTVNLVEVDEFSLGQLSISFFNQESNQNYEFELNSMEGAAVADEPLKVAIDGAFHKQRYYISISGDPVEELFKPTQPWHLEASAEMAGVTLNFRGLAERPLEGKGFDCLIKLNGDRFENLAPIFDSQLPQIGAYALAARMKETATGYSLSKLKGNFGKTTFNGKLDINLIGDKPAVLAELMFPTIDAGLLYEISGAKPTENQSAENQRNPLPALDEIAISMDILNEIDADVKLMVNQVINAPGDIRDASLKVSVHDGELTTPMTVTFADVAFRGNLDLKEINDMPGFLLSMSADETDLGNLALVFTDTEGIEGHFKSFKFSLGSAGHNLRSLLQQLDMQLALSDAALSYGNFANGHPVSFTLDRMEAVLNHDKQMRIDAAGALLDVPLNLAVSGGSFHQILAGEPWPVEISADGGGARMNIKGAIAGSDDQTGSNLDLEVSGKNIGGLSAWLGVSPSAKLSYALKGRLTLNDQNWEMNSLSAHLGKTKLKGQLGWKPGDNNSLLTAKLRLENVDPAELAGITGDDETPKKESGAKGFTFDMPIMPQTVEFNDADIDIGINRINLRKFDITRLSLTSRIRDGWVAKSPFQATVEDVQFRGELSLDLRSEVPQFKFKVGSSKVDIGMLLAGLNIADGIDAAVGSFGLDLLIKGGNLREILNQSEFSARMKNGNWTIRDPNTNASLVIRIMECVVTATAGQPVSWVLNGLIKEEPVTIKIMGDRLAVLADKKAPLPLNIMAEAAGVRLKLDSIIDLPFERNEVDFKMSLSGERLNSINNFLEIDLPPYGPYELGGRFQLKKNGYYLTDLIARVNQSHITGKMSLDTVVHPPLLEIDLTTRKLQIDDFRTGDWSPVKVVPDRDRVDATGKTTAKSPNNNQEVQSILSPEFMRKLDVNFNLDVQQVFSGKDNLGNGNLAAGLSKGRFFVDPMQLNIPGGSVMVAFVFEPTDTEVALETSIKIEQFDYGVLARRIRPASDMKGRLSLDIDLKSQAKNLDTIMDHADGYIDFAIVPENFEANLFELWAVNLLTAVLPKLDSEASSKVNCAVFRFDIEDGRMKEDAIFADTTKMQVGGEAQVNFKTDEIYMAMTPKAKRAEFFSLATPIQVKGTFTDYKIGVQPGGLIGTTVRFITSPIVVPIQRIFTERVAKDGQAACVAAMHRAHE
jgi:uncharacterized protein involved in outer membrane biogenesis